jgi:hypothetical protein
MSYHLTKRTRIQHDEKEICCRDEFKRPFGNVGAAAGHSPLDVIHSEIFITRFLTLLHYQV